MFLLAAVNWLHYMFMIPLTLLSVFLILVILVQRGRGGGLTGALGGMGGQSAFGTKAGDLFTRITIVVAAIWVILSMASLKMLNQVSATANMNRSELGQPTATTKAGEGLPGAKLPDLLLPGKTAEAELPSATPTTPAPGSTKTQPPPASSPPTNPSPAPATGDAGAKSPDADKP